MYWRPWMQTVSFLPLGGEGWVVAAVRKAALALELGGSMMLGSLTKVTTVSTTRTSAAATVQEISSGVLPWIWAANRDFLARNLITEYNSAPSTTTNTNAATYRMILYSESIWLAFGEPPDFGVKKDAIAPGPRISKPPPATSPIPRSVQPPPAPNPP